jgi:hypothetical protein
MGTKTTHQQKKKEMMSKLMIGAALASGEARR